jgi:hypothetical protein
VIGKGGVGSDSVGPSLSLVAVAHTVVAGEAWEEKSSCYGGAARASTRWDFKSSAARDRRLEI